MKIIINASGIVATGATQVTVSFIRECINFNQHTYYLFLNKVVAEELGELSLPQNFTLFTFSRKAFFDLKGIKTWKRLIKLEKKINPDCVFSVFEPSVWKPSSPHLMGFAYAYYIYPESPLFSIISLKQKIRLNFLKRFHGFYLSRNANFFVCETKDVSRRLPGYLKCNPSNVYTVTNTFNDYYINFQPAIKNKLPFKDKDEFRFVTLSSFATHKNLKVLNEVIPILNNKLIDKNVKFVLTLHNHELDNNFSHEAKKQIINLGRIKVEECPQVYHECDALFLPTLMECFSASYAEAMKMGKPIVTSDLSFAHTVCEEAALYFDPVNPEDIAQKIIQLVSNEELRERLIAKGNERILEFDTPHSRAVKYLKICEEIIRKS